jgi:REP element-mobilizing transposase RayT
MPRLPRLQAPGSTVHVVGRCNNREFCFTTPADFMMLLAHLAEMARTYEVTLYGYTLMANHLSHVMGSVRGKGPSLGPRVPIQFP